MMTGTVPSANGGTFTMDQIARTAVAGLGRVFADPEIDGQHACVAQLTTLLVEVHETLAEGDWLTPQEVRAQARALVTTLKPYLFDADRWGTPETSTEAVHRRVERSVASAIRLVISDFVAKAVSADER